MTVSCRFVGMYGHDDWNDVNSSTAMLGPRRAMCRYVPMLDEPWPVSRVASGAQFVLVGVIDFASHLAPLHNA